MSCIAAERTPQQLHTKSAVIHATAGAVRECDYAVNIRKTTQGIRVAPTRKKIGDAARHGGRAVHAREYANVVTGCDLTIASTVAHEGGCFFCRRCWRFCTKRVVPLKTALVIAKRAVMDMHVFTCLNVSAGETDNLVVATYCIPGL